MNTRILTLGTLLYLGTMNGAADEEINREKALDYLLHYKAGESVAAVQGRVVGHAKLYRYDIESEGLIRLSTKGWVYLMIVPENGRDIVLAIDHDGNLYRNDADVCGGLQMVTPTGSKLQDINEFLNSVIYRKPWKKLNTDGALHSRLP